jgi:hypothetical protein
MRFALFSLIVALLAAYAMAVAPLRAVIVSYPNDAPQSLVDEACEAIEKAVRDPVPSLPRSILLSASSAPSALPRNRGVGRNTPFHFVGL